METPPIRADLLTQAQRVWVQREEEEGREDPLFLTASSLLLWDRRRTHQSNNYMRNIFYIYVTFLIYIFCPLLYFSFSVCYSVFLSCSGFSNSHEWVHVTHKCIYLWSLIVSAGFSTEYGCYVPVSQSYSMYQRKYRAAIKSTNVCSCRLIFRNS